MPRKGLFSNLYDKLCFLVNLNYFFETARPLKCNKKEMSTVEGITTAIIHYCPNLRVH